MCEFPSWIEEDSGKAIFLVDADVEALIENHGGVWEDYIGHEPLKKYLNAVGRECEQHNLHPDVANAIRAGQMNRMAKVSGFDCVIVAGKIEIKDSRCSAHGWSQVVANYGSKVEANAGSKVEAYAGSTVVANYGSTVVAYDGSTVVAYAGSTVKANSGSTVVAYDGSTVVNK